MRARGRLFLSDADTISRRTDDHILSLPGMHASVEGELDHTFSPLSHRPRMFSVFVVVALFLYQFCLACGQNPATFSIVTFVCVWKRPLLTNFVLSHYNHLKHPLLMEGIDLQLFIVGSESEATSELAQNFSAAYAVHPNSPLGAKHDKGIQSLRDHYLNEVSERRLSRVPDAVAVIGSDDIVNHAFFTAIRNSMATTTIPRKHVIGLRDIYFYDLRSRHLVYTKGYRSFKTQISGTLGCGRVYSWAVLDVLRWRLWDIDRERGLDQSATRNLLKTIPMIEEVSMALLGRDMGIAAVDIKTDGYSSGTNIWKFNQVVEAVGRNGRFHDFETENDVDALAEAFGDELITKLDALRGDMTRQGDE